MLKSSFLIALTTFCFLQAISQNFVHEIKLTSPKRQEESLFGSSVDIYGKTIMVGAPGDTVRFNNGSYELLLRGSIFVLKLDSFGNWNHHQKISPPESDSTFIHEFGRAVSCYGNFAFNHFFYIKTKTAWTVVD